MSLVRQSLPPGTESKTALSLFYSLRCTEYTEFSSGSRKYLLWNLFGDLMREEKNPFGEKVAP